MVKSKVEQTDQKVYEPTEIVPYTEKQLVRQDTDIIEHEGAEYVGQIPIRHEIVDGELVVSPPAPPVCIPEYVEDVEEPNIEYIYVQREPDYLPLLVGTFVLAITLLLVMF